MNEWTECQVCGNEADEYCHDGTCRSCHVSVSWEDCVTGTWNARMMIKNGHTVEYAKQLYPEASLP